MDILPLLICLRQCLDKTTLRQLSYIIDAMLSISGRITMSGISRWTEKGCSYRTIQRFFNASISWCKVNWILVRSSLSELDEFFIAGDETTVTKSGKATYGLGRYFSSIFGRPVLGISFFSLSLVNATTETSHPIMMEQVEKQEKKDLPDCSNKKKKKKAKKGKRKPGRPEGSKNKDKKNVELSYTSLWMQALIRSLLLLIGPALPITYFVYDGAFGHNDALQMVRQCGLHLISKLRYDSALWFPYSGPYSGRGPRKKYGEKLDYNNIPAKYRIHEKIECGILTSIYQMHLWHKEFADMLNIVVIVKTNLKNNRRSHVVLFTGDLEVGFEKIIHFYRLRFQIEFNFRDAKQHWGLEDWMNINAAPIYNGANLSMFMVNFSQILLHKQSIGLQGINDLKTWFRGRKYVQKILKLLQEKADPILIDQINNELSAVGRIHAIA